MADVEMRSISRVLVANRGEIARRIFHTASEMGISTVAVYADGDAQAPFVLDADTAIALRGRTATETYLDIDKVIDAVPGAPVRTRCTRATVFFLKTRGSPGRWKLPG